jgi:hypothetical protein
MKVLTAIAAAHRGTPLIRPTTNLPLARRQIRTAIGPVQEQVRLILLRFRNRNRGARVIVAA